MHVCLCSACSSFAVVCYQHSDSCWFWHLINQHRSVWRTDDWTQRIRSDPENLFVCVNVHTSDVRPYVHTSARWHHLGRIPARKHLPSFPTCEIGGKTVRQTRTLLQRGKKCLFGGRVCVCVGVHQRSTGINTYSSRRVKQWLFFKPVTRSLHVTSADPPSDIFVTHSRRSNTT